MPLLSNLFIVFSDTLTGHLALAVYLLAVTDEHAIRRRLKKLPPLLLSPLFATLLSMVLLQSIPAVGMYLYYIASFAILVMCTLWVRWAWHWGFWQSFSATCMASVFQVADATLTIWAVDGDTPIIITAGVHLGVSIAAALLLYRLRFGMWFRLLLDSESAPWRTALLLFALEAAMEVFLILASGIQPKYLPAYYLLAAVLVVLMAALIVYLAQRFDDARKMQAQQDVIAQQRLYEQDLEAIRREVRSFRHDYKNLLAEIGRANV